MREVVSARVQWAEEAVDSSRAEVPPSLAKAVISRRAEFAAGRRAASMSLTQLGLSPAPLDIGPQREPVWPAGIVGSITHTSERAIAIAAHSSEVTALGLDLEALLADDAARDVLQVAMTPNERVWLTDRERITAAFSGKESLYKALFPLVRQYFDMTDAEASRFETNHFTLRLLRDLGAGYTTGFEVGVRFHVEAGHVVTAVEW